MDTLSILSAAAHYITFVFSLTNQEAWHGPRGPCSIRLVRRLCVDRHFDETIGNMLKAHVEVAPYLQMGQ